VWGKLKTPLVPPVRKLKPSRTFALPRLAALIPTSLRFNVIRLNESERDDLANGLPVSQMIHGRIDVLQSDC
jgi:hypothetical protein